MQTTNGGAINCSTCTHKYDTSSGCFAENRQQCEIGKTASMEVNPGMRCSSCMHMHEMPNGCDPHRRSQCTENKLALRAKSKPTKNSNKNSASKPRLSVNPVSDERCSTCKHRYETASGCSTFRERMCSIKGINYTAPNSSALDFLPDCPACEHRHETSKGCSPQRKQQCTISTIAKSLRLGWVCAQCGKSLSPDIPECSCSEHIMQRIDKAVKDGQSQE